MTLLQLYQTSADVVGCSMKLKAVPCEIKGKKT